MSTKNEQLQRERLLESIERECGNTFMQALHDDEVFEIALNPDGRLWTEKAGRGWEFTGTYILLNER